MITCASCGSQEFELTAGTGVTLITCANCDQDLGAIRAPYEPDTEQNARIFWADKTGEM